MSKMKKIRVIVRKKLIGEIEYICEVDDSIDLESTPIAGIDSMDFDGSDAMGFDCKEISSKALDGADDCEMELIEWEEMIPDNVSVCTLCDQHTNDETETKWDCWSDPYCENCFDSFQEERKRGRP
tara:strand:+ start:1953 stop:2330 length:378 start_codon:yes stop_codon:yes gene_type:complete